MALKKIKFVWGTPTLAEDRWRLGVLLLQEAPDPTRPVPTGGTPGYWKGYLHHTLYLSVRGLLAWGAVFAVLGYLAAAGALYVRYERANPHNRIGYLDLALPTRWSERHRLQGEGFILLAREKFEEGRFNDGFSLLRAGVGKHPADFKARLDLAGIYIAMRLRTQAEKLMEDGLALGYPGRDYLKALFSLAAEADRPDHWVALCRRAREQLDLLPEAERPAGDSLWLDQETSRAFMAAGLSEEALKMVENGYAEDDPFRREMSILALLERKDGPAALAIAERWTTEKPREATALRLLIRCQREVGDFAAMDESMARFRTLYPTRPDALLYAVVQYHLGGRTEEARAALDELIFRHGANANLYPTLTAALAGIGFTAPLPDLAREMRDRGISPRPVLIAQLQAHVTENAWPEALATIESIRRETEPPLGAAQEVWLETMNRLARACMDGGSGNQSSLVEAVADNPGTLRVYRVILDSLLAADRVETAAQVLALAEGPYPTAQSIVSIRSKIQERRAAITAAQPKPAAVDAAAAEALSGLAAFSAAFEARVQAEDPQGALDLLSALRRAQPAWMVGSAARLDALELPVRARGEDPLRLQLLTRNALGRDRFAPNRMLVLARAVFAEGYRANALLMLKEILRRDPAHTEALAQLAIWEPRDAVSPDPPESAPER